MLKPTAVQATLKTLLESPNVPADSALVLFSESGTIYAQAHSDIHGPLASTSKLFDAAKPKTTESQRLQFARQPGLVTLLGSSRPRPVTLLPPHLDEEAEKMVPSTLATPPMELALDVDGRAKILAALACQSWLEETNRVRRLFTKIHGHSPVSVGDTSDRIRSLSTSTGGNGSGNGKNRMKRVEQNGLQRIDSGGEIGDSHLERKGREQDDSQEFVAAPVAVPGTLLNTGTTAPSVAPLLLEGELGALLIMPLYHQPFTSSPSSPNLPQNSSPLLFVLAARHPTDDSTRTKPGMGASFLSQSQWNQLHDAAKVFANHVSPSLRKAFGREGREVIGDAISQSDLESSVDFEAATTGTGTGTDLGLGAGISVR